GGRGTGKTTALRCMSYEGQFALKHHDANDVARWQYYGMYYRFNTNRVTAFDSPALSPDRWQRFFGHYLNLILCDLLLRFLEWHALRVPDSATLPAERCRAIARSLNLGDADSIQSLSKAVVRAHIECESSV